MFVLSCSFLFLRGWRAEVRRNRRCVRVIVPNEDPLQYSRALGNLCGPSAEASRFLTLTRNVDQQARRSAGVAP